MRIISLILGLIPLASTTPNWNIFDTISEVASALNPFSHWLQIENSNQAALKPFTPVIPEDEVDHSVAIAEAWSLYSLPTFPEYSIRFKKSVKL